MQMGNASAFPLFYVIQPGGAYFFATWKTENPVDSSPPMRGGPGLLTSQHPHIYIYISHRRAPLL